MVGGEAGQLPQCLDAAAGGCEPPGALLEDSSLLQQSRAAARGEASGGLSLEDDSSGRASISGTAEFAIAFEGGGFLAQADYMGLFAALLHELPKAEGGWGPRSFERLLQKFGIVSSVSGGTWFTSQLVYSKDFEKLLYAAALAPELTAVSLNTQYYAKVLNPLKGTSASGTVKGLAECIYRLLPLATLQEAASANANRTARQFPNLPTDSQYLPWYLELAAEAIILLQAGGISWEDLVQNLFLRGAGIDRSATLGTAAANRWAKGKLYLQAVTSVVPSSNAIPPYFGPLERINVFATGSGSSVVTYNATAPPPSDGGHSHWALTPAKFSVIVGGGRKQKSPLPFCAREDCFNISLSYMSEPSNAQVSTMLSDVYRSAFEEKAGLLPISSTAAAGSAFEGDIAVQTGIGAQQGCLALAVWASGAGAGRAFTHANTLRDRLFVPASGPSEGLFEEVARAGLQPLIDGGGADSTGIAIALGAGAKEVLAIVNTGRGSVTLSSLLSIFVGSNTAVNDVIASPTAGQVEELYGNFDRIPALPGSKYLQAVIYGSISCVTAQNDFFGVPGGQNVTLNIISVETDNITLGLIEEGFSYNSFFNFGTLSGEVARTLTSTENQAATRNIIEKFFL